MRWNAQKIKADEPLKANKLYELDSGHTIATITEHHEDSDPEVVDLEFHIPVDGQGIIAKEYRNKDFSASKSADILCILLKPSEREVLTHIYDIKRTMTGYDESKTLEELRKGVVKRIQDFIVQLRDSMIHKDGLVAQYTRYEDYREVLKLGIITREFDDSKLDRLSEQLQSGLYGTEKDMGPIGQKYYISTQPLRKEIEMVNDFRNKRIKIWGQIFDLHVFLLEYSDERNGYYKKIMIS